VARRHEILEVMIDCKKDYIGDGPSYRELLAELNRRGFKMCLSVLRVHIDKLEYDGLIEKKDGRFIVVGSSWVAP
jgi:repressor of nif and glnA expression